MTVSKPDIPDSAAEEHDGAAARTERSKPSPSPRPRPRPRPLPEPRREDGQRTAEPRTRTSTHKPARRASVVAALAALVVLLALAATWFAVEANQVRAGEPLDNAAIVDSDATARVEKEISAALKSIFSYNYASLDRTRRAADRVLLDEAMRQYNAKFAKAAEEASNGKLVRTTSVRAIGVRELHVDEGTARVVVFLDQQTLSTDGGERSQSTVYLEVLAEKVGGSWKIARLSGHS